MSEIVSLSNPGLIPMEAVTTMGVSAKEGENPIGFFGTGLKYAIAGLLRTGHKITIFCGLDRYDFTTEMGSVRGKDFDFIVMSGPLGSHRLGFTTHLGSKWETWQIFRELYSNALDENGKLSFYAVDPMDGQTTIHVTGSAFANAARNKDEYFLSTTPIFSSALVEVHAGASTGIFYRGVRVMDLPKRSVHTYNLVTSMDLTEDRTLKSPTYAGYYIGNALANCTVPGLISAAVTAGQFRYEGGLNYQDPCEFFAETVLEICERQGVGDVSVSAVKAAEQWAQREARVKPIRLSAREEAEIEEAKSFLSRIGYPITSPVTFTETLGANIAGMAKDGNIYIARLALIRGGNYLAATLLEEQLHITHGFEDESRRFQDYLFDMVVKFAKDADYNARVPA